MSTEFTGHFCRIGVELSSEQVRLKYYFSFIYMIQLTRKYDYVFVKYFIWDLSVSRDLIWKIISVLKSIWGKQNLSDIYRNYFLYKGQAFCQVRITETREQSCQTFFFVKCKARTTYNYLNWIKLFTVLRCYIQCVTQ